MKEVKTLYYKKGRRYYEVEKLKTDPINMYYENSEGELIPFSEETMSWYNYTGKPKQGIWRVNDGSHKWIGDFGISDFRIRLEKYRDLVLDSINTAFKNCEGKYISRDDISTEILNQLEKYEKEFGG